MDLSSLTINYLKQSSLNALKIPVIFIRTAD